MEANELHPLALHIDTLDNAAELLQNTIDLAARYAAAAIPEPLLPHP